MNSSVIILGRQPALGLAELESLYGPAVVRRLGATHAAAVAVDPCLLAFDRLGGAMKFCKLLNVQDTTDWKKLERFLADVAPGFAERMPEGKMHLGVSAIGFNISPAQLTATALTLKKAIKKTGRNVRVVPNKEVELNTASVLHNNLTTANGWELVLIRDDEQTVIAQTVKVQDIDSYTLRDRGRPKRDARVGMLPPKLAQILINLAVGQLPTDKLESICDIPAGQPIPRKLHGKTVLDPFCGTGVVLQEAMLMGYDVYGSDADPRMVEYSERNIDWLAGEYHFDETKHGSRQIELGDATSHQWKLMQPEFVASETYLGRPFTTPPPAEVLNQTVSECNLIIKKFLRNIHSQLKPGTRLCLAVPAWQVRRGQFRHLPLVDSPLEMGYNRVSFEHVRDEELLYYREDQFVARELLVITRK